MSNLYSHREEENNQKFNQLSLMLHQFRTTVDRDIHGRVQLDMLLLDAFNDNMSQLWSKVKRTSSDLLTVMNRNASLSRIVGAILIIFFLIWTIHKLR